MVSLRRPSIGGKGVIIPGPIIGLPEVAVRLATAALPQ